MRALLLLVTLLSPLLGSSVFRTNDGKEIKGDLISVYGSVALFEGRRTSAMWPLAALDENSIDEVAAILESRRGQVNGAWKESQSTMAKALKDELQVFDGRKMIDFDPAMRPEPEFYLIYFSAHWCGPCRQFTPRLVETYNRLKLIPKLAERFELVFVSSDTDKASQDTYVRSELMRWPFVRYGSRERIKPIERWRGNGIPCLVVLNRDAKLIFHSYDGEKYLGAEAPLQRFCALLEEQDAVGSDDAGGRLRLARKRHLFKGQKQDLSVSAYRCRMDWSRFHGLEINSFRATLSIDENGCVQEVTTIPELLPVYADNFREIASDWLFLPAIKAGKAVPSKVSIPIKR